VKFNGAVAMLTSATPATLVAKVPSGATTGPISVTVGSKTATSSTNFVIPAPPRITSVSPKSALLNVVLPGFQVIGTNLLGATFSFSPAGPAMTDVSVNASGNSVTLTVSAGKSAGTFALIASNPYGHSSTV